MIINANKISKSYGTGESGLQVLKDFSLEVKKGEIVTISGQSGCGKSTALNILGTLDSPDSGKVIILDKDVQKLNESQLSYLRNTNIGFVFQFHHLLPDFSAFENVLIPTWIKNSQNMESYALELFERLDLIDRVNHMPGELSGGERSRVALIRAIINKPAILFADEPTGNLDEKNSIKLVDLLCHINRDFNQTIILTTHNPDVAAIGNKRFVLDKGLLKQESILI
ncbi:MAG: ABC transporter ATP-binding protein [Candidatus Neomarinimicrobiota bacterium]